MSSIFQFRTVCFYFLLTIIVRQFATRSRCGFAQSMSTNIISCVDPLGFPFKTADPFIFCVYHNDNYPAGDEKMQAPRRGSGADFNPKAPYRMYHGDRVPGFPQHPHRGFETVTATLQGTIDHTDSCGNAGRYGGGDLQWMTAGRGVVHGEMFPLIHSDKPNTLRLFQIWLNLPKSSKMVDPGFAMHWAEEIPHIVSDDGKSDVTVWAGSPAGSGKVGLPPPPDSYGSRDEADLGIFLIKLSPGGTYTLPPAKGGASTTRTAYFVEGIAVVVGNTSITQHCAVTIHAQYDAQFSNPSSDVSEVLILQGKPIGEPVAHSGPFVMNTQAELQQAYADYQRTQFGGWPWQDDAVVFPKDKGRFSLLNGTETVPSSIDSTCSAATSPP